MNVYEKLFVGIAIVLIIAAVAVTILPAHMPEGEEIDETALEGLEIINTSVNMGRGLEDYTYSFAEKSNGYSETYMLVKNGDEKYVETDDILSVKKVYFMQNDTVLCVDYMGISRCSSTKNNTDSRLKQYYSYLKSKFLDDVRMANEEIRVDELFEGGYLQISSVEDSEINGHACRMVNYVIDYREMSISEAEKYSILPSSPKYFEWQICADDERAYYKYFTYTYGGNVHEWEFTLYELGAETQIQPPEELAAGAYDILVEQMGKKGELTYCLNKETGDSRERCVAKVALDTYNMELCEVAGKRRDRCLVSLMPFLLDESVCDMITDASFRDDCYIEMAGGKKDAGYCGSILNESKTELCMNVSREDYGLGELPEESEETNQTDETNESTETSDVVKEIFEQIENEETNSTEEN